MSRLANQQSGKFATWRNLLLLGVGLLAMVGAWLAPPVPQDLAYHDFADQRRLAGVPNFWNVVSNLPFLVVGIWGLRTAHRVQNGLTVYAYIFALGLILVCFGSGWFHLEPNNSTLFWDRLPMTISFMAFFSFGIAMVAGPGAGKTILWPLIAVGIFSVVYWDMTEAADRGDLRLYALVQFLPGILLAMFLMLFPGRFACRRGLWLAIAAYILAKLFEWQDQSIWSMGHILSGHTLKHLAAAAGAYYGLAAIFAEESRSGAAPTI